MNTHLLENIMVPMRDGIHLATDVYFPEGYQPGTDLPLPVILERTPYNKSGLMSSEYNADGQSLYRCEVASYFTKHGYSVVFQDCRGRHASEGDFIKYTAEANDGEDTIKWIMGQPWCNQRVGTMGLSYNAHTQMALACLAPKGLRCMFVDSGGFHSAYECGIRQGGAFELKQVTWAYKHAQQSPIAQLNPLVKTAIADAKIIDWFDVFPWKQGHNPLSPCLDYETYLFDQWRQEIFDDSWKQVGIYAKGFIDQIPDIPITFVSSWYDVYVPSTLDNFKAFRTSKHAPMQLIMGPWLHGRRQQTYAGNVSFGPTAKADGHLHDSWFSLRIEWFDRWLKDRPIPDLDTPQAKIFLMGGGTGAKIDERIDHGGDWIQASDYPLLEGVSQAYYLHPNGELSTEIPDNNTGELSYLFDPKNPVPTIGGALTSGQPVFVGGGFNQVQSSDFYGCDHSGLPLNSRHDILSFQTPPLENDILAVGDVDVFLWVSTDAPDTDFTAKLLDIYPISEDWPQGYALNLSDGIMRAKFHTSFTEPQRLKPDECYLLHIRLFATANRFVKGHRIRLDISSSNFPKFDVNPNTGLNPCDSVIKRIAQNTVHVNRIHASYLQLTLINDKHIRHLPLYSEKV